MRPLVFGVLGLVLAAPSFAEKAPFADVHLHYNWDQEEVTTPQEAIDRLKANNVVLGVVSGTPSERALKLRKAGGKWIVPFFSPYIHHRGRADWFTDPKVVDRAREALDSGRFFGIGEAHFIAGVGPSFHNEVVQGLLDLAREYDVPFLIHTESSSHEYFEPVCRQNPEIRFQWAHAGARLGPEEVGSLMEACPNVWTELSARDPGRYGYFADADGSLDQSWIELFNRFPDRFMTGADPVWPPGSLYRWDVADTGWDRVGQFLDFHRNWLDQLPSELARKIRLENPKRFYAYVLDTPAGNLRAD
ncbi:amidohydrolase family protein [Thiohalorhabdus sp.]|uniref:amidohydrolase family protein n=1 Tax=Thiohalorhabdus sp. TaxID=3094134 RepID=UPI002FC29C26